MVALWSCYASEPTLLFRQLQMKVAFFWTSRLGGEGLADMRGSLVEGWWFRLVHKVITRYIISVPVNVTCSFVSEL